MYATGAAINFAAVLDALGVFAASAGWTVNYSAGYSPYYTDDYYLNVSKGGCTLGYYKFTNMTGWTVGNEQVSLIGATGYLAPAVPTSGAPPATNFYGGNSYIAPIPNPLNGQPGASNWQETISFAGLGPYAAYHFFSTDGDTPYLHAILEINANLFMHWHGGLLPGIGGAGPCTYVSSSYFGNPPNALGTAGNWTAPFSTGPTAYGMQVSGTIDSSTGWFYTTAAAGRRLGGGWSGTQNLNGSSIADKALLITPNTYNGLSPLIPISYFLERGGVGAGEGTFAYVGDVPDARLVSIANFSPLDEITLGADVWKIFPCDTKRNPGLGVPQPAGFAFRKSA